jgi:alkyl hydroperoxide reductase subunit AhpC
MANVKPEFDRRGVKMVGLSVDSTSDHERWAADIEQTQGHAPNYPIIGDVDYTVSKLYGMLPAEVSGDPSARMVPCPHGPILGRRRGMRARGHR